jgi:hypothetical protein
MDAESWFISSASGVAIAVRAGSGEPVVTWTVPDPVE